MQRYIDAIHAFFTGSQFCASLVIGFIVGFVRITMQKPRSSWLMRCCEAFLCSMLSGAVSQLAIVHFGLTVDYAIPIAVFISFLGTEFFSSFLIGILKHGFNGHINHKS